MCKKPFKTKVLSGLQSVKNGATPDSNTLPRMPREARRQMIGQRRRWEVFLVNLVILYVLYLQLSAIVERTTPQ